MYQTSPYFARHLANNYFSAYIALFDGMDLTALEAIFTVVYFLITIFYLLISLVLLTWNILRRLVTPATQFFHIRKALLVKQSF